MGEDSGIILYNSDLVGLVEATKTDEPATLGAYVRNKALDLLQIRLNKAITKEVPDETDPEEEL